METLAPNMDEAVLQIPSPTRAGSGRPSRDGTDSVVSHRSKDPHLEGTPSAATIISHLHHNEESMRAMWREGLALIHALAEPQFTANDDCGRTDINTAQVVERARREVDRMLSLLVVVVDKSKYQALQCHAAALFDSVQEVVTKDHGDFCTGSTTVPVEPLGSRPSSTASTRSNMIRAWHDVSHDDLPVKSESSLCMSHLHLKLHALQQQDAHAQYRGRAEVSSRHARTPDQPQPGSVRRRVNAFERVAREAGLASQTTSRYNSVSRAASRATSAASRAASSSRASNLQAPYASSAASRTASATRASREAVPAPMSPPVSGRQLPIAVPVAVVYQPSGSDSGRDSCDSVGGDAHRCHDLERRCGEPHCHRSALATSTTGTVRDRIRMLESVGVRT